jgi:hypothetical protein
LARAKQTNRAEARRRYRQTLAQGAAEAEGAEDSESAAPPGSAGPRPTPRQSEARPSLGTAFRQAYHQAHYREDLRALPGLLTLTQPTRIPLTRAVIGVPWFLVSALLVVAGFLALLTSPPTAITGVTEPSPSASPAASR